MFPVQIKLIDHALLINDWVYYQNEFNNKKYCMGSSALPRAPQLLSHK